MERLWLSLLASSLLSGWVFAAQGGELGLLVNGHAMHLDDRRGSENEANYGLGLQYDQPWRDQWLWFAFSSGFQSSQNAPAYNFGSGMRRRFHVSGPARLHMDFGAAAMVIAHDGYHKGGPVPALLPVASLGWSHFALNAAYVPPINDQVVPLVFLQFMYSLTPGGVPTLRTAQNGAGTP